MHGIRECGILELRRDLRQDRAPPERRSGTSPLDPAAKGKHDRRRILPRRCFLPALRGHLSHRLHTRRTRSLRPGRRRSRRTVARRRGDPGRLHCGGRDSRQGETVRELTPYWHGKPPIVVINFNPIPWEEMLAVQRILSAWQDTHQRLICAPENSR